MAKSTLPKYFVMEVWDEIRAHINIPDIQECFKEKDENAIIEKIYNESYVSNEIYENSFITNELEVKESLRINKKRRNQTKKRWVQSSIKDYEKGTSKKLKELRLEYEELTYFYEEKAKSNLVHKFLGENPQDIIEETILQLKSWCDDPNSYLANYPYILEKSNSQIEKALTADITVLLGDLLLRKYNGKIQDVIVEKPYSYVDHPVFSEVRGKLELEEELTEDENVKHYYNDYNVTPDYNAQMIVESEYAQQKQVGVLDKTDERIFAEVLNHRNGLFATKRKIFVEVGKIIKALYKSDNLNTYKLVAERLVKMRNVSFNIITKDRYLAFGLFDYVDVRDEDGVWMAEITVNEQIYQEYLNKQTIRMYKAVIQKFELPISRILIFALQKERFLGKDDQPNKQVYPYIFFLAKVRFKNKNRKENFKLIENSLQEMVSNGICIKEFKRVGDSFHIEYIPITEYEVEDLLDSSPRVKEIIGLTSPSQLLENATN